MEYKPKRIVIDTASLDDGITRRVTSSYPEARIDVLDRPLEFLRENDFGKGTVVLTHNRERFVKDFKGSSGTVGCGEKYIASIMNCPFNCSYCYLRTYLDYRSIVIFTNTDRLMEEVAGVIEGNDEITLTTGEFSDSLALEHITETTRTLLPLFSSSSAKLELRTKTSMADRVIDLFNGMSPDRKETPGDGTETEDKVNEFLPERFKHNLIVTWTLAPRKAIKNEEPGTASLNDRMEALEKTASSGIKVGIRLDPVIPFYFEEPLYREIVEELSRKIPQGMIERIEIGTVRFPERLVDTIGMKRDGRNILKGDFVKNRDGKFVLIRPLRIKIYRALVSIVRRYMPDTDVVLSMESNDVAEDAGIGIK